MSHVVRKGQRVQGRDAGQMNQQRVVSQCEEEGGERESLLHTSVDEDPNVRRAPQDRVDPRAREQRPDDRNQPLRETDMREEL